MKKRMMGFGAVALLAVVVLALLAVGVDWTPTPATCEPHGLRQMPC